MDPKLFSEGKFICDSCGSVLSRKKIFVKHKLSHKLEAATCDICGKLLKNKYSLNNHKKLHESQPISCPDEECSKLFLSKSALKNHRKLKVQGKKVSCEICGEKNHKKENLIVEWEDSLYSDYSDFEPIKWVK